VYNRCIEARSLGGKVVMSNRFRNSMFWKDQKIEAEWEKGETWLTLTLGDLSQTVIFMNPEDARRIVGAINMALDKE